jgi:hypothetical protein
VGTAASADQWEFFFPAQVVSFGCKVNLITSVDEGRRGRAQDFWEAGAFAERKEEGRWAMTVGMFQPDTKGLHQAEKACNKWVDEASKRVKKAR